MADSDHTGTKRCGHGWGERGPAPITPEYLRELFTYDAGTGSLTWKIRPSRHFHVPGWADFWNRRCLWFARVCGIVR